MTEITFPMFIDFLYSKFLLSFIICFFGALITQIAETVKQSNKMKLHKIFASAFSSALVVCVIIEYKELTIGVYTFLCFFLGLWGADILKVLLNQSYIMHFVRFFLKSTTTPVGDLLGKTLEEIEEQKEKAEENTDKDKE